MANCCFYWMQAASKSEEALNRLVDIMKYEDPQFHIYRVRECSEEPMVKTTDIDGSDIYCINIQGDVAWSSHAWLNDDDANDHRKIMSWKPGMESVYVTLPFLSKELGVSMWCITEADDFSEWFHIHDGEILDCDTVDLHEPVLERDEWDADNLDDELDYIRGIAETDLAVMEALPELYHRIGDELKKPEEDRYLSFSVGGYQWESLPACDIYSSKVRLPKRRGIDYYD